MLSRPRPAAAPYLSGRLSLKFLVDGLNEGIGPGLAVVRDIFPDFSQVDLSAGA